MDEIDFVPTPDEMATLNGVEISPALMHAILTRFMALPANEHTGPDPQLTGLRTVCGALDVAGDTEMLALVAHLRIGALNDLVEQGALRDYVPMKHGGASMDLTLPVVYALATETVILNGERDFAFDADRFRRAVVAAAALARAVSTGKRTGGKRRLRTGPGKPRRPKDPSH